MSAVDYRPSVPGTQVTPYTTDRRIVGTPEQVADTVDRVRRSGRLVVMSRPRLLPEGNGRVFVTVRFLTEPVRSTRQIGTDRRRTRLRTAGLVAAIAVAAAGAVAALLYALSRLLAELLPYLGVALVLLVGWALLGRAGVCPGLHCPGCSHRGHR